MCGLSLTGLTGSQSTTASTEQITTETRLLNSVAVEASQVLAAGCMSWILPAETPWFCWKPAPQQAGNDALEDWLQSCTTIALEALSSSNFYTNAHLALQRWCVVGTANLWQEQGQSQPLAFRTWDSGSFCIAENAEGTVDMLFREIEYSGKQASEMFARLPPEITNTLAKEPNRKHRFLRAIFPRPADQRTSGGPNSMAFCSKVIHMESRMLVADGGFEEFPSTAIRFLKWSESSPYGASPAMRALAEIRGVNYLEMLMSTLAEVTVNPRIIMPQGLQGVPDLRAGGITYGGLSRDSYPTEWATGGSFDIGLKLIERKEHSINEAFNRSLFELFQQRQGELNIPHVRALEAEKLCRFSPAYTSLTTEFINPLLERTFMILWRSGKFPKPPQEALFRDPLGRLSLAYPRVAQTSRMALAMQALKETAFASMLEMFSPVAQVSPVFDNVDFDRAFRDLARGKGVPADYLVDQDTVKALRAAREQAQQAQQKMEMAREAMKNPKIIEGAMSAAQQQQGAQAA